ncbi:MAG: hypothetical protein AB7N61_11920, partial [Acidimicrobiia bacterium]
SCGPSVDARRDERAASRRCYTSHVRSNSPRRPNRVGVVVFVVSALPALVLAGCSRNTDSSPATTTPPDQAQILPWVSTTYGTTRWSKRIIGSSETDGSVKVLTDLAPADSANGLLICNNLRSWWPTSATEVVELRVVTREGNTIVKDLGDVDGCE